MIGFSGSVCVDTPKREGVYPIYAIKYLADYCDDNYNGTFGYPQPYLDLVFEQVLSGNFSNVIELFSTTAIPTVGSFIFSSDDWNVLPGNIKHLFSDFYNNKNQYFIFYIDESYQWQSTCLRVEDTTGEASTPSTCDLERFSMKFNNINALGFDINDTTEWDNWFANMGSVLGTISSVQIASNDPNRINIYTSLSAVTNFTVYDNDNLMQVDGLQACINMTEFTVSNEKLAVMPYLQGEIARITISNSTIQYIYLDYTKVEYIGITSNNYLNNLIIPESIYLIELNCSDNKLNTLQIANCTSLGTVFAPNNLITSVDFTNLPVLGDVSLANNQLSIFDGSSLLSLEQLDISENNVATLDVSSNTELIVLAAHHNQLSGILDLTANTKLQSISVNNNNLTELLTKSTAVTNYYTIIANDNQLTNFTADYSKMNDGSTLIHLENNLLNKDIIGDILNKMVVVQGKVAYRLYVNGTGNDDISSNPSIVANYTSYNTDFATAKCYANPYDV